MKNITNDLTEIIELLGTGKTMLYPTDTIWGLGCDATNALACTRILEIKKREPSKSFVCLVSDDAMLNRVIPEIPEIAWDLLDEATSPLTLVLPNAQGMAKGVAASDGSAAFRMIKEGPLHKLIHRYGKPIVSTSANISGNPPAVDYSEVDEGIKTEVDFIIDQEGFPKGTKKPSSIIKVGLGSQVQIIRP